MKDLLVFIHVKKTGGISLQRLLSDQFGDKFFGGHTHSALKHASANPIEKSQLSKLPSGACICKHWTYDDFSSIHNRAKFITIVRDPVSRIISHYNFYLQHHPKGQSFVKYIRDPKNINVYSRFLPGDLSCLSEVLLFESLQDSINQSEIILHKDLKTTNKTRYVYFPTEDEIDVFKNINHLDIELYEKCIL